MTQGTAPPSAPRPAGQAGFTLLEILVALVVLGFLVLGLSEGVRFGLRALDSETTLVDRQADMDAMERLLRGLIAGAEPADPADSQGSFNGHPRALDFIARLPVSIADTGLIGPMTPLDAELGLGVDDKHRLVLRWRLHPHAQRLTPLPPPAETVLLEGVDHLDLRYQRPAEQGGGWGDSWDLPTLPTLVRVSVTFQKGDRRHWPSMEVAPMITGLGAF